MKRPLFDNLFSKWLLFYQIESLEPRKIVKFHEKSQNIKISILIKPLQHLLVAEINECDTKSDISVLRTFNLYILAIIKATLFFNCNDCFGLVIYLSAQKHFRVQMGKDHPVLSFNNMVYRFGTFEKFKVYNFNKIQDRVKSLQFYIVVLLKIKILMFKKYLRNTKW